MALHVFPGRSWSRCTSFSDVPGSALSPHLAPCLRGCCLHRSPLAFLQAGRIYSAWEKPSVPRPAAGACWLPVTTFAAAARVQTWGPIKPSLGGSHPSNPGTRLPVLPSGWIRFLLFTPARATVCWQIIFKKKKKERKKAMICSICQFLWYKHSHHGLFPATNSLTSSLPNSCISGHLCLERHL